MIIKMNYASGSGDGSSSMGIYAVNAKSGNGYSNTQTITVTKKITKFLILCNLWNGASGTYWTAAYQNSVKINGTNYNDWGSLISAFSVSSSGNYISAYGAWFALCEKILNIGDTILLDLSGAGSTTNYGLAIVLLD